MNTVWSSSHGNLEHPECCGARPCVVVPVAALTVVTLPRPAPGGRRTPWRATRPGWMTRGLTLMTSWRRSCRARTSRTAAILRVSCPRRQARDDAQGLPGGAAPLSPHPSLCPHRQQPPAVREPRWLHHPEWHPAGQQVGLKVLGGSRVWLWGIVVRGYGLCSPLT